MKVEFTNKGWKIVRTEHFTPKFIVRRFTSRTGWVDYTKRYIKSETPNNTNRFRCTICRKAWTEMPYEFINLAQMEKHTNQVICEDCANALIRMGVKYYDRNNEEKETHQGEEAEVPQI